MSTDELRSFVQAIQNDDALRARLESIKSIDEFIATAKEAGFLFADGEFRDNKTEISDEALAGVVGTGSPYGGIIASRLASMPPELQAEIQNLINQIGSS